MSRQLIQSELEKHRISIGVRDPKSILNEISMAIDAEAPSYETKAIGPSHRPKFKTLAIFCGHRELGEEKSRKLDSEESAAGKLLERLYESFDVTLNEEPQMMQRISSGESGGLTVLIIDDGVESHLGEELGRVLEVDDAVRVVVVSTGKEWEIADKQYICLNSEEIDLGVGLEISRAVYKSGSPLLIIAAPMLMLRVFSVLLKHSIARSEEIKVMNRWTLLVRDSEIVRRAFRGEK